MDASSATIPGIRTDIAGFVGIAIRGPVDVPVPVESWRQFEAHFGGCTGVGYLAYGVRAFFENGGRRCWVTRVASLDPAGGATAASAVWSAAAAGHDVWRIEASSAGSWGNMLSVRCIQTHRTQTIANLTQSTPEYTTVASTTGLIRGTLVRLSQQAGGAVMYKVISDVDPVERRVYWVQTRSQHADRQLPYDGVLEGLDPNQALRVESVEYTLAVTDNGRPVAVYEGLSPIPEHPRYGPKVLAPMKLPTDIESQRGIPAAPYSITLVELRAQYGADPHAPRPSRVVVDDNDLPVTASLDLTGGRDGLALLSAYDFIGEKSAPEESDASKRAKLRGLRALGQVHEVSMVAIPDIHIQPIASPTTAPLPPCMPDPCLPSSSVIPAIPKARGPVELPPVFSEADIYRVQADLIQHCEEKRDRFAILDAPFSTVYLDQLGISGIAAWRTRFDSKYAALYYPWPVVVDPLRNARTPTRAIPPSGHVAGQYAQTDITVGVHKAPANAPLNWAQDVTANPSAAEHGQLNSIGVNVLRPLPGRAIRILGARTISSDPSWRFVNVRRLVMMIQKAIDLATQWAVFEPNNHVTRSKLRLALITYLSTLWQQGALAGTSMDEAFFVKCDEENNSADDRANGRMVTDIGVAPAYPFEFVVLRVWRAGNELEFAESTLGGRGH